MHASIVRERPLQQLRSMPPLRSLRALPSALAHWAGFTGRDERPGARILLYHGTPRREAAALERELRWLKRRFHIVPLRAIVAASTNGGTLGSKVALTFDDGLRSNVEVAYPLLHRLAIPATFFVCPGLVDRARWLWTHETRCRLSRLSPGARRELAREWQAPEGILEFVSWMKTLDSATRQRIEARVREATPEFKATAAEREEFDLADWKALRRLEPGIITIGSHTLTHPILPGTAAAELETEVRDSRRQLERSLERPVDAFAYPNGDLDPASDACVRKHYRVAVTTAGGWVRRGADSYRLPGLTGPSSVLKLAHRIYA
jgi:peptidoglycan/xylan/chitin deacetylase (PgdA/CDA1 family)